MASLIYKRDVNIFITLFFVVGLGYEKELSTVMYSNYTLKIAEIIALHN